jgi:hypothetical protein
MRCDIVIVSHKRDLHWLSYCLQFLQKNWREPNSKIIVRLEEDCREIVKDWRVPVTYRYVKKWPDGYTFQMYQKMISDDYSDADLLMLMDSDLMLLKPTKLSDLLQDGKPVIEYVDWEDDSVKVAEQVWRGCTSQAMGIDLDRDYMIRTPSIYWRDTFSRVRQRIVRTTGKGFYESIYSDVPFTAENFMVHPMKIADFEALNLYAVKFQPEKYVLIRRDERQGEWPFHLYWSHGDWSPKVHELLEQTLRNLPDQQWETVCSVDDPYVARSN